MHGAIGLTWRSISTIARDHFIDCSKMLTLLGDVAVFFSSCATTLSKVLLCIAYYCILICSKRHAFNTIQDQKEQHRQVLTLIPSDWAAEWLRPLLPNMKMIGPVLPEPGKPLPSGLEVISGLICSDQNCLMGLSLLAYMFSRGVTYQLHTFIR